MLTTAAKCIAPPKRLLYGPGPSMVEPRAYEAMSKPVVGLRDSYFLEVMAAIQAGLRQAFGTSNQQTFLLPSGGSGGMEAAVANFVEPASKFLIFASGHFADRMTAMGQRQRAQVVRHERAWGEVPDEKEARAAIEREKPDVVGFVQAETSTGAYQAGANIAPAAREAGALVIMDCVTSLGAMPVKMDETGVDVAFSCSQKGLSCPAGLAPLSLSPRAWERVEARRQPPASWYFDLKLLGQYFNPPHVYHHTPSPPLYYALHDALAAIDEEGLENRWERHRRAGERLIAGLARLGFQPLVKEPGDRIWHLTSVLPPPGVDEAKLRERLLSGYGIEIAAGLGQLSGKILRIGTMGPLATGDNVEFLLQAIEASL